MKTRLAFALALFCRLVAPVPLLAEATIGVWSPNGEKLAYFSDEAESQLRLATVSTGKSEIVLDEKAMKRLYEEALQGRLGNGPPLHWQCSWVAGSSRLILGGVHQIVSVELQTRRARTILSSEDPLADIQVSPNGRWISFLRRFNIEVLDLRTCRTRPLTTTGSRKLREGWSNPDVRSAFTIGTSYWWAPDSSAIAYLETDGSHASFLSGGPLPATRLWVSSIAPAKRRSVDLGNLGNAYIPRVNWFSDSRRLAVQVLNREQTSLSLLIANPADPKPVLALAESDRYWVNVGAVCYPFKDGKHLLWSTERSGYRHLVLYDLETQKSRTLTSGPWEVGHVSYVDEAARQVYFTATLATPLERQLYRVSLDGGPPTRLTVRSGTHHITFAPDGNAYLDTWSDADTPPERSVRTLKGDGLCLLDGARRKSQASIAPQFFTVRTHDGARLDSMLFRPPDFVPGRKYPVVIEANGSPQHQLVLDAWDNSRRAWHEAMAQAGYVILVIDCRGSGGHGHLFEEPLHYRLGAQETSDIRDAVDWLWRLPYIDHERIGIWGRGYNGFLSASAILAESRITAAAAISPVVDWKLESAPFVERFLGMPESHHEEYEKSSLLERAGRLTGKMLVITPEGTDYEDRGAKALTTALTLSRGSAQFVSVPNNPDALLQKLKTFFIEIL